MFLALDLYQDQAKILHFRWCSRFQYHRKRKSDLTQLFLFTPTWPRPWRLPLSSVHLHDTDHTHTALNIPAIHCIHDLIFLPATFSVIAAITHSSFLPQGRVLVKVKWLSVSCKRTQQWNRAFTSRRLLSSTFICLNPGLGNQSGESRPLGHGI